MNMNNSNEVPIILHSKKQIVSYRVASLPTELIQGVLSLLIFFFYEVEIGLNSLLVGLGIAIYAIWDAFNDPLIGYLTDRPFKWTKKWGRRFPFIIIGYVPMLICFLLIFTPPDVSVQESPWIIFGWLVLTTCLFDTTESIWTVNYLSLFPDKFRDRSERRVSAGFEVYLGFIGVIFAFMLPPLIIIYGNLSTYALMAWICVAISLVCFVLMIPGIRDDKETVENFLTHYKDSESDSFFKTIKQIFSQKSFVAFLAIYVLYQALVQTMMASFFYFTKYNLEAEVGMVAIISAMLLIGGLISVPFWLIYTNKTKDHRKTFLISAFLMACFASAMTFIYGLTGTLIIVFLFGIALGGFWVMISPVFSDVIDESVSISGKRRESTYGGIRNFFLNLARVIQAMTLAIVHELTGFVEGSNTQTPLALIGIRLHLGLIPGIFIAIGLIVFWKNYDITPGKAVQIKEKLIALKL
ncbi:MAG: MFS transporter [Promethearchaeota archaeon]|nr:MAG: MFS transporter [Candidatus Lokiarchaeota archaeon]